MYKQLWFNEIEISFNGLKIKSNFKNWSVLWRERFTFIPERGFIFARVKTGQVGTWSLIE